MTRHRWVRLTGPQLDVLRSAADSHMIDLQDQANLEVCPPGTIPRIRILSNAETALTRAAVGRGQPVELTAAETRAVLAAVSMLEAGPIREQLRDAGCALSSFERGAAKLRAHLHTLEERT